MADSNVVDVVNQGPEVEGNPGNAIAAVPAKGMRRWEYLLLQKQTFHYFPKLPPELRIKIWQYAVHAQRRVVTLEPAPPRWMHEGTWIHEGAIMVVRHAPAPALFLVNKESLYEATKSYIRFSPTIRAGSTPSATGPLISFDDDIFCYREYKIREGGSIRGLSVKITAKQYLRFPLKSR